MKVYKYQAFKYGSGDNGKKVHEQMDGADFMVCSNLSTGFMKANKERQKIKKLLIK